MNKDCQMPNVIVRHSFPNQFDQAPHETLCKVVQNSLISETIYFRQSSTDESRPCWTQIDEVDFDKLKERCRK